MDSVKLEPKTPRARRLINEAKYPKHWIVIRQADEVAFSERPGPWYFVRPDNNTGDNSQCFWVARDNDKDFIVLDPTT